MLFDIPRRNSRKILVCAGGFLVFAGEIGIVIKIRFYLYIFFLWE